MDYFMNIGVLIMTASVVMLAQFTFGQNSQPAARPDIAVYYFPNYHPGDPRNEKAQGKGWSEWQLVKDAKPRFAGEDQPKVPLWGYVDESDPKVMAKKIDAAADNGINAFIFDWYYYQDGPFLDGCLDKGYLKAPNRQRTKFALMWANHDWQGPFPYALGAPRQTLSSGVVTPEKFDEICDHIVKDYFLQPSYWKIDGKPYFSFYELSNLLKNFGSVEATRAALDRFRAKAVAAGLPGIHLNAIAWGTPILPAEHTPLNLHKTINDLGFDSITSYVWVHHTGLPSLQTDYNVVRDGYNKAWSKLAQQYTNMPYFPNVSMGWDPSPRARQSDRYGNLGYPFMNTITGNTPERFKEALTIARDRIAKQPHGPYVLTINSWNEWTEGSYIEPDTKNGTKYLEAIRDVFGVALDSAHH